MRWPPAGNLGPKTERSSLGGEIWKIDNAAGPPAAPRAKRPPIRRRPLGLWIKGQIGEVIALALHADQV